MWVAFLISFSVLFHFPHPSISNLRNIRYELWMKIHDSIINCLLFCGLRCLECRRFTDNCWASRLSFLAAKAPASDASSVFSQPGRCPNKPSTERKLSFLGAFTLSPFLGNNFLPSYVEKASPDHDFFFSCSTWLYMWVRLSLPWQRVARCHLVLLVPQMAAEPDGSLLIGWPCVIKPCSVYRLYTMLRPQWCWWWWWWRRQNIWFAHACRIWHIPRLAVNCLTANSLRLRVSDLSVAFGVVPPNLFRFTHFPGESAGL